MSAFQVKKFFGDDHEICYDSVGNHDVYKFLRVSLEVPRNQTDKTIVLLNGKEIGEIFVSKDGSKTLGYTGYRYRSEANNTYLAKDKISHRHLGKVVAAIISDYAPV